ncbi:MAG: hypothetical protein LBJ48_05915 [Coriobacteriales bacterium]|jgi:hypothetical protein|nr:hypothetical protein [Coriobacteriales bacterium]
MKGRDAMKKVIVFGAGIAGAQYCQTVDSKLENGKNPSSAQLEFDCFLSDYATTKRPITSLYYYPITYAPKLAIVIRKLFATKPLRRFTNLQSLPTRAPCIEARPEAEIFKGAA